MTLPNTENEPKVAIWASGTPEQFFLHVQTAMHVCKLVRLDTIYANATTVLEAAYCKLDVMKMSMLSWQKPQKRRQKTEEEGCKSGS